VLAIRKIHRAVGGLSVDEIDVPEPGPHEVRIKVAAAGICGTDLNIYNWLPHMRHARLPVVLGHELAGVVDSIGSGVTRAKVGDHVSVESHLPCGRCETCLNGWAHVCGNTRYPGIHFDGAFAPYVTIPEEIAWVVNPEVPLEIAALMEPLGLGVHASMEGTGVSGKYVVVSGCGPIGLMNIAVAKALGALKVIATDVNPIRLAVAEAMGADCIINVGTADGKGAIMAATGGAGADVYIDFSAAAASLALATEVLAGGGSELRLLSVPPAGTSIEFGRWLRKGLVMRVLHGRRLFSTWLTSSRLLAERKINIAPIISHRLSLADAQHGFEEALSGRALKVMFQPEG
jgi:threonine 3-dehydrogenase